MKKFAILCGMALTLGMVSCDDMLPNPPAQTNPEPGAIFTDADLTVSQGDYGTTTPIVLATYADQGIQVPVLDVTKLANMPEGFTLSMPMIIGSDAAFSVTKELETTTLNDTIFVSAEQLNAAIREVVTKDPGVQTVNVRFPAYAVNESSAGDASMRLGGMDVYYATLEYLIKPIQTYEIEQAYYLVGNFCGWDVSKAVKMEQTVPGTSVYDSPVFAAKINVEDDQLPYFWKVVPASAVEAGNLDGAYGVIAEDGTSGSLVAAAGQEQAGEISAAGPYLITINAENYTYSCTYAMEYLWVPNNGSSTNPSSSRVKRITTNNYINYSGVVYMLGDWFLTGQASLDGLVYTLGSDESNVQEIDPATGVMTGHLVNDAGGVKMRATKGLYYLDVNLGTMNYTASPIAMISAIGAFNGWDLATAIDLKPDNKFEVWTGKDIELTEGSEFKFCCDHAWTLSFGGAYDDLVQNGGNLVVPGDGGQTNKYDIKIDFTKLPYTCTLTKK